MHSDLEKVVFGLGCLCLPLTFIALSFNYLLLAGILFCLGVTGMIKGA